MPDFKLIAIRPLKNCNPKFLKVLKEYEVYKFYSNYAFKFNENDPEAKPIITYDASGPQYLYKDNIDEKIEINISAIVGKNGSGKSTLIELLFAAVYNLSLEKKILKRTGSKKLTIIENIAVELYYSIGEDIFCLRVDSRENAKNGASFQIIKYVNIATKREFVFEKIVNNSKRLLSEFFFYTISINYSIYSLNSESIGPWLIPLFHKNDGYQTPLVINPMRNKGNLDIKTENDLVKQRLLSNILEPITDKVHPEKSLRNLADEKIAVKLELKLNQKKIDYYTSQLEKRGEIQSADECVWKIFKAYTGLNINVIAAEPEFVVTKAYILSKLIKMCRIYARYRPFFKKNEFQEIDTFVNKIIEDSSHITFKVKQAMNFLRHQLYQNWSDQKKFIIDIETFSNHINDVKEDEFLKREKRLSIIELIPPSIFDTDILFDKNGSFDDCSSGEKQRIHSISSIVYHIINLNSVFKRGTAERRKETYEYKYINLVFDEVELYFHPDFQRKFINDLIGYVRKINAEVTDKIAAINMCFSTHSPFILSDIPNTNILYLEIEDNGKSMPKMKMSQTFGANIHDLLANEFFMKEGFMGEWAKEKIRSAIDHLNASSGNNLKDNKVKPNLLWDRPELESLVDIIGEPLLKESLNDLYSNVFKGEPISEMTDEDIDAEIKRLQELKKSKRK